MTGDLPDIVQRLRLTLPARWFGDVAPILDGVLSGLAAAWAPLFGLVQFVRTQSRLSTATDIFLDGASRDFFGTVLPRRTAEADDLFRSRVLQAMHRQRATRSSLVEAAAASGFSISIFEAARPADTGSYNVGSSLSWGVAGAWGSMQMPFECLVVAQRQAGAADAELLPGLAAAMPAGGAVWVRVVH